MKKYLTEKTVALGLAALFAWSVAFFGRTRERLADRDDFPSGDGGLSVRRL